MNTVLILYVKNHIKSDEENINYQIRNINISLFKRITLIKQL